MDANQTSLDYIYMASNPYHGTIGTVIFFFFYSLAACSSL